MLKLFCTAILAAVCLPALIAQTQANPSSDDTVVVGNPAQPVQWEHRGNIADAINKASPHGTVIIPAGYQGTDCNPVSSCNLSGSVTIVDWRGGGFASANFASPPALGNATPNTVAATTMSALYTGVFGTANNGQNAFFFNPDSSGTCEYTGGPNNTLDELSDVFGILYWNPNGSGAACQQVLTGVPYPPGVTPPDGLVYAQTSQGQMLGAPASFPNGASGSTFQTTPGAFATLATCNPSVKGTLATVTDATLNTWGSTIVGGGGNIVLAFCNGTNWTIAGK